MEYYLKIQGTLVGPMSAHEMMAYDVNPNIAVSIDGGLSWQPLYAYPELMNAYRNSRHAASHYQQVESQTDSKRILCGVLALLIGGLGIQYFVIGKTTGGILTILLSLVTCGAWSVITFIQGILMLCMTDEEFNRKFVDTPKSFPIF